MDESGPSTRVVTRKIKGLGNCPVCEETMMLENKYDVEACYPCNTFFEECVQRILLERCLHLGSCEVSANLLNCHYCRMSKCYNVGMDSTMVLLDDYYYEDRDRRRSREAPPIPSPFELSWECAEYLDCLLYMEQHYYLWLNLSSEYRRLTDENKEILRKKSFYKGTVLQLMERSIIAHDVLWLQHCFWDAYSCDMPPLRPSAVMIMDFVIDLRDVGVDQYQFKYIKLKLALKDDVTLPDEEAIPDNIYEGLDDIANEIKLRHEEGDINLRNEEDIRLVLQSRLFEYATHPERYEFPEHSIVLLPQQEQSDTHGQSRHESREEQMEVQPKEGHEEQHSDNNQAGNHELQGNIAGDNEEQKQEACTSEYYEMQPVRPEDTAEEDDYSPQVDSSRDEQQ